ncbi:hypothetical protein ACFQ1I_43030 [Kitasatospora arboriphila]
MHSELQELGRAVKRVQYRQHRALETGLAAVGTTLAQWDALRAVGRQPGASARTLAAETFQTEQAFGTLATARRPGPDRADPRPRPAHRPPADTRGERMLEAAAPSRRRSSPIATRTCRPPTARPCSACSTGCSARSPPDGGSERADGAA